MMDIFLETEDSPLSEVDWLMYDGAKDLGVIKGSGRNHARLVTVTI
jgi:hypothetical protein